MTTKEPRVSAKDRLVGVATDVFAEVGFEQASIQEIARRAGVSKAKVFYHFDGKEVLYAEAVRGALEPLLEALEAAADVAFWEDFEAGLERAFAFGMGQPQAAALVRDLYRRGTDTAVVAQMTDRARTAIAARLTIGRKVGAVRTDLPVSALAEALVGALMQIDRWLASQPEDFVATSGVTAASLAAFAGDALRQRTPAQISAQVAYAVDDVSPETNPQFDGIETDVRTVTFHNERLASGEGDFWSKGFELIDAPHAFQRPPDEVEATSAYTEIETALRNRLGAKLVRVFDHTLRNTERQPGQRPPIRAVHADYDREAGVRRLQDILSLEEAERHEGARVVIANIWQSVAGIVHSMPLGFIDISSVADADFIPITVRYPQRVGRVGFYRPNPDHHWSWFPFLRQDEALLFKTYDSAQDGVHWSCPHATFDAPNSPPEAGRARSSIEFRVLLTFDGTRN